MNRRELAFPSASLLIGLIIASGCVPTPSAPPTQPVATQPASTPTPAPAATPSATATPTPTPTLIAYGPNAADFPAGINPLTGMAVDDPELLKLPAVLVSISNFPKDVRPQSGMSFASVVWDFSIAEGMDRFLTIFYGSLPPLDQRVGPIRSARDVYAHLAAMYTDSCLVYAGADKSVQPNIPVCHFKFGSAHGDGTMLDVADLLKYAQGQQKPEHPINYASNYFAEKLPAGGTPATQLGVYWSFYDQEQWQYDPATGKYQRYEDQSDKTYSEPVFHAVTDALTGGPITYKNLVVLFADHTTIAPTRIDIDLSAGSKGNAYLLRDGMMFRMRWSTEAGPEQKKSGLRGPVRFLAPDGSPMPLAPGQVWIHLVSTESGFEQTKPGIWQLTYRAPEGSQ